MAMLLSKNREAALSIFMRDLESSASNWVWEEASRVAIPAVI